MASVGRGVVAVLLEGLAPNDRTGTRQVPRCLDNRLLEAASVMDPPVSIGTAQSFPAACISTCYPGVSLYPRSVEFLSPNFSVDLTSDGVGEWVVLHPGIRTIHGGAGAEDVVAFPQMHLRRPAFRVARYLRAAGNLPSWIHYYFLQQPRWTRDKAAEADVMMVVVVHYV